MQANFPGPHDPNDVTQTMHDKWKDTAFPMPHKYGTTEPKYLVLAHQHYVAMIENIDSQCGRLINIVKERGELENTIIIYSSDHGEMLSDHDRWQKSIWYEPSVCVLLLMAGPNIQKGKISDALLKTEDLAITRIEASNDESLKKSNAISLWLVLKGETEEHREFVISALTLPNVCEWKMVYDGHYKLILQPGEDDILFDMGNDPQEDENIADANSTICNKLRKMHSVIMKRGLNKKP